MLFRSQSALWQLVEEGALVVYSHEATERKRMRDLMEKYQDVPMDFADATLVTMAEALGETRIFTLDSDFQVYRMNQTTPFAIVP